MKPSECEKHFELLCTCIWSATKKPPTNAEKKLEKQRKKDKKKAKKEKKKAFASSKQLEQVRKEGNEINNKRFTLQQIGTCVLICCS